MEGEHAENILRKDFVPSERVAIEQAVEELIGNRQGQRTDTELVENLAQVDTGKKTREVAAEKAGFGNPETYRQAKTVLDIIPYILIILQRTKDQARLFLNQIEQY